MLKLCKKVKLKVTIAASLILILFFSSLIFLRAQKTIHSATVSLLWQEASLGLNPNGTNYDPYEMVSNEVLEKAEEKLSKRGLNEDLSDTMWVRPSLKGNGKTYAVDYVLYYNGEYKAEIIFDAVLTSYQDFFEKKYIESSDLLNSYDYDEKLDFLFQKEQIGLRAEQLMEYVKKKQKLNPAWIPKDNSIKTYSDLADQLEIVITLDLSKLETYIMENSVSKNAEELKNLINYRDKLLEMEKGKYDAQYQNRLKAIEIYDPTLFPTISVPSINDGEYYVTTTKTGLDYIYEEAALYLKNSLSVQRSSTKDSIILDKITKNATESEKKRVEVMINDIKKQLDTISEEIKETDETYVLENKKVYFDFKY